ncbi:hypothetical protein ACFL33_02030 [Pseudomonadota bacterium]
MRQNQLSVFSDPARLINAPFMTSKIESSMISCVGNVDSAEAIYEDQAQFSGWALSEDKRREPYWLYVYDGQTHESLGLGRFIAPRPDVSAHFSLETETKGYLGFARLGEAREIWLLGQFVNGDMCSIGRVGRPPPSRYWSIELYKRSREVELVSEVMEGSASRTDQDASGPLTDPAQPTFQTGSDAFYDTGEIVFGFRMPSSSKEVALPIKTGPIASSQIVELRQADGTILDTAAVRPLTRWESVVLSANSRTSDLVEVHIKDDSSGWGSWMAVGYPRYLDSEVFPR